MATWTPVSPTVGPQAVTTGPKAVGINAEAMFSSSSYGTVFTCSGDRIGIRGIKTGTLTTDCYLQVWLSPDGGTQYGSALVIPYATLNDANGFYVFCPTHPGQVGRIFLVAGTMTGANGVVVTVRA